MDDWEELAHCYHRKRNELKAAQATENECAKGSHLGLARLYGNRLFDTLRKLVNSLKRSNHPLLISSSRGSGLTDQSQKMTVAASATAEKTAAQPR